MNRTHWIDIDGHPWLPSEMTPSHRRNTLAFARRNVVGLWRNHLLSILRSLPEDPSDGVWHLSVQVDCDLAEAIAFPTDPHVVQRARDWLESEPVIIEMSRLDAEQRAEETIMAGRLRDYVPAPDWWDE